MTPDNWLPPKHAPGPLRTQGLSGMVQGRPGRCDLATRCADVDDHRDSRRRKAGDPAHPLSANDAARVLILTTFGLDEYVYEALCAGASGFVLKDDPPEQLISAVRTVAAGNARCCPPAITKHVIRQFTRIPRPAPPKELSELTERELEILRLIATGLSNPEIGRTLFIGETTVKTHVTHILQKLGLRDRVQAVVLAYQAGLFARAHGEC